MKKKITILVGAQALFTILQVYLISRISLIGKVGISLFYKEYRIFRSPWKTYILFFGIQLTIILLLYFLKNRYSGKITNMAAAVLLAIALFGLLYTYNDFLHTYSHRLLKERFHLGFYLFWTGWISTCVFFLTQRDQKYPQAPRQMPDTTLK